MKHIFKSFCLAFVVVIVYYPINLYSQQSILTVGGNISGGSGSASYSLGQISYQYFYNGSGYINQGVQQPAEYSTHGSPSAPAAMQAQMAIVCAGGDLTGVGAASYSVGQVGYTYNTFSGNYQSNAGIQQATGPLGNQSITNITEVTKETLVKEGILVYPNPSNGNFTVRISSANKTDNAIVNVLDLYGRIVTTGVLSNNGGILQQTFSSVKLSAGMYVVQCNIGGKHTSVKLSVVH